MSDEIKDALIVRAPLFPTYTMLRHAIHAFADVPIKRVRETINIIFSQTGTPQNPVDWSNPDQWITDRLSGESQEFARKVWEGSGHALNPRHLYGSYLFINRLQLLDNQDGVYRTSKRSDAFLNNDEAVVRELDACEGLPKLLSLVAERSPCRRGDILPAWSDYLKAVSLFSTDSTFKNTLSSRLVNLADRELIARDGSYYSITAAGLDWLKGFAASHSFHEVIAPSAKRLTVAEAARAHNDEQLIAFQKRLIALEPIQFEHFVKALLDAMDYEDVQVTKLSGDKGVDVVAKVQFGITEIIEVVQVKRTENSITRPKIDELRGALPYHKALRGTIISLGNFSTGARDGAIFPGAAPITLIDGRRLLDLCIKHEVGVRRRPVEIYEIDEAFFVEKFASEENDETKILPD